MLSPEFYTVLREQCQNRENRIEILRVLGLCHAMQCYRLPDGKTNAAIGKLVAEYAGFDGYIIGSVCVASLDDANYHAEAAQLEQILQLDSAAIHAE